MWTSNPAVAGLFGALIGFTLVSPGADRSPRPDADEEDADPPR